MLAHGAHAMAARASRPRHRWTARRGALLLLAAPGAFLGLFYAWPMAHIVGDAVNAEAWRWMAGPYMRGVALTAFTQAVLSTVLAMAAACPLAWFHHARRVPGGRWLLALHAMPFVMP